MIRRFLDTLHRELADQMPERQFRPNELSREVARAERLRREARQARAPRPAVPPQAEEQTRRERPAPTPTPQSDATSVTRSLKSRAELRRAMLLKEILGPPAALRWPRSGDLDL